MNEFESPEDYMDRGVSRDRELIVALAAALRPPKASPKETIYNTLIVAAIVALVGAVWTLSMNVARLEVKVDVILRESNAAR